MLSGKDIEITAKNIERDLQWLDEIIRDSQIEKRAIDQPVTLHKPSPIPPMVLGSLTGLSIVFLKHWMISRRQQP